MNALLPILIPAFILLIVPLVYFFGTYNRMVSLRNSIAESWRNIDTELQRRYDLIPNLVETVKGYAAHEQQVFEEVTKARSAAVGSQGSPNEQAADEKVLVRALGGLFAVAEGYPELKASDNFMHLQKELINTEDRIQASRRFYNGNVRGLNNKVEMFPSSIVASMMGFKKAEYFEVDSVNVRMHPGVNL